MRWAKAKQQAQTLQPSIFDQAERAKTEGMEVSYRNAGTYWQDKASEVLQELIRSNRYVTSEDVIIELENRGITTGNNKALGALMTAAKRAGQIKPTGEWTTSKLKRRHGAPLRKWETVK